MRGPLPKHEIAQVAVICHVAAEDDGMGAQIKTWFSMESYATRVNVSGRSKDDKRAPEQLEKTTKMVDGQYEVGLPWAEENATIQNNYFSAHSQFFSLERRLEKDESLKQRYEETITVDAYQKASWMKPKTKHSDMYCMIQSLIPTNPKMSDECATQQPNTRESRWMTSS